MAKEDRGFASMDRAKQREIASKGGKAAHQKGTAHEWTSEEARDAGRKGGIASHQRRREQSGPGPKQRRSRGRVDQVSAAQETSSRGGGTVDVDLTPRTPAREDSAARAARRSCLATSGRGRTFVQHVRLRSAFSRQLDRD